MLFTGLDFALAPGESALVSGPNGIGKSSLLRMLCGLLPIFAGSIEAQGAMALADERLALDMDQPLARALAFWAGIDAAPPFPMTARPTPTGQTAQTAQTAQASPPEPTAETAWATARAQLSPTPQTTPTARTAITPPSAQAVMAALEAMALAPLAQVPVRMLSTGQRKRAVLARTIASGAPIWLLDEPANGLDTASIALLGTAIESHLRRGGIIVAASHQPLPIPQPKRLTLGAPVEAEAP